MSEGETNEADGRVVTPGFFEAVGATLVDGRFFDDRDNEESRHVAIVDDLLASKAWPGESAVGQEIEVEVRKEQGFVTVWADVGGVVQHMRHHDPRFQLREQFFVPFAQGARNQMGIAILAHGDPLDLVTPVEAEIAAVDKDLAISSIRLLDEYASDARAVQRLTMVLAAGFAVMALVLGFVAAELRSFREGHRARLYVQYRFAGLFTLFNSGRAESVTGDLQQASPRLEEIEEKGSRHQESPQRRKGRGDSQGKTNRFEVLFRAAVHALRFFLCVFFAPSAPLR